MEKTPHTYIYRGIRYVRLSELPEGDQARLRVWLFGQTTPAIPGLPPEDLVYARDYERWQQEQRSGEPLDWD